MVTDRLLLVTLTFPFCMYALLAGNSNMQKLLLQSILMISGSADADADADCDPLPWGSRTAQTLKRTEPTTVAFPEMLETYPPLPRMYNLGVLHNLRNYPTHHQNCSKSNIFHLRVNLYTSSLLVLFAKLPFP